MKKTVFTFGVCSCMTNLFGNCQRQKITALVTRCKGPIGFLGLGSNCFYLNSGYKVNFNFQLCWVCQGIGHLSDVDQTYFASLMFASLMNTQ